MARKRSGLEEHAEFARRMNRWLALRNKKGDETAYALANAVTDLHASVLANKIELEAGLAELEPLFEDIREAEGQGNLFKEAKQLIATLEQLKAEAAPPRRPGRRSSS